MLLAGLLLCGIGAGILFVEFTDMRYGGEYVFETDTPTTKTMEVSLEDCLEGDVHVQVGYYSPYPLEDRVVVDETMEEGLIRVEVTFDPERVAPMAHLEPGLSGPEGEPFSDIWIQFSALPDDLSLFFQARDMILKDLKNNTLRSYRTVEVMDLTITAGPETAGRLIT